jgi:hypothetical protein
MATKIDDTVVGVFADHDDARAAIRSLQDAGFTEEQIGVASTDPEGPLVSGELDENYAGEGAVAGAVAGAGVGALWGMGILAGVLPAIGPAIAGGTLGILLSSAAAGAGTAGLVGGLMGLGLSKEEAEYYETEMKAGRAVVTVNAGGRRQEARRIVRQHGGYDRSEAVGSTATTSVR